jgi:threonylcarbamoyladenosine tRNA methylthiotransferase MtaB
VLAISEDRFTLDLTPINRPTRIAFDTLGCKLNQAETEKLARQLSQAGYRIVDPEENPDIYLKYLHGHSWADRKARNCLRKARRRNPLARIIALGCYAEKSPRDLSKIKGIDLVVGNTEKFSLKQILIEAGYLNVTKGPLVTEEAKNIPILATHDRTRSFIKVQEGCSNFCAYCVVPYVRGTEKSLSPEDIVGEIKEDR